MILGILVFLQPAGLIAADTKHDLTVDPAGFLAGALHAWNDTFTLGQLQNQAYGYLFPHGLFFLATDFLPDWVAQRLWWTMVLGVGFSGFLLLAQRLQIGSPAFRVIAAFLYALSPRTLTTLTAISSETWPVMLAPWVIIPLLGRLNIRAVAMAVLPVALMGAVNATATLAACTPAGIILLWRLLRRDHAAARALAGWLLGCLAVSLWWIGPLLVLGRYSAPFTDFIESSFVTTRWLNLIEILRGTTSWAPFVDTERVAGNLLVSSPTFVLLTVAIAALGLYGLSLRATPHRWLWVGMLLIGVAILGAAHGPFAGQWLLFLDGAGAPLRNLHKFDPLVRLPLLLGFAALGVRLRLPQNHTHVLQPARHHVAASLVVLIATMSLAPAWSGRLLPQGSYQHVPSYWQEATNFLNAHAAGTRTLITPPASFARQEWGWTRDEPAQPLLEVPWAVRDAVPLIHPEAVRGLDGVMAVLQEDPASGANALRRLGIGAVLIRHDLVDAPDPIDAEVLAEATDAQVHSFGTDGQVEVVLFDAHANLALTSQEPVSVAGGGEVLALLDAHFGTGPRILVSEDAQIVTDTPMLTARNYGTLDRPVSAPLAHPEEGADVRNAVSDYPSAGPLVRVEERGGQVRASSSAADATSFGGADPARSVTASVDKHPETAWWPTPGTAQGQWLELVPEDSLHNPVFTVTATDDTKVDINGIDVDLVSEEPTEITVQGAPSSLKITLTESTPVGISEANIEGVELERVVVVPDTSPDVRHFLFQRLHVDTGVIIREFTAPRPIDVVIDSSADTPVRIDGVEHLPGERINLSAGAHRVVSDATWVSLKEENFDPSPAFESTGRNITSSEEERIFLTGRSANPGLQATLGGEALEPTTIDAATQAFLIPAGLAGEVTFSFAGDTAYRGFLFGGGVLALLTVVACGVVLVWQRNTQSPFTLAPERKSRGFGLWTLGAVAIFILAGWPGLLVGVSTLVIRRITVFPGGWLAAVLVGISGAWLARGPWPSADYAGDSSVLALLCVAALASLLPNLLPTRTPGSSTRT